MQFVKGEQLVRSRRAALPSPSLFLLQAWRPCGHELSGPIWPGLVVLCFVGLPTSRGCWICSQPIYLPRSILPCMVVPHCIGFPSRDLRPHHHYFLWSYFTFLFFFVSIWPRRAKRDGKHLFNQSINLLHANVYKFRTVSSDEVLFGPKSSQNFYKRLTLYPNKIQDKTYHFYWLYDGGLLAPVT